jgi:hypothetical protein
VVLVGTPRLREASASFAAWVPRPAAPAQNGASQTLTKETEVVLQRILLKSRLVSSAGRNPIGRKGWKSHANYCSETSYRIAPPSQGGRIYRTIRAFRRFDAIGQAQMSIIEATTKHLKAAARS